MRLFCDLSQILSKRLKRRGYLVMSVVADRSSEKGELEKCEESRVGGIISKMRILRRGGMIKSDRGAVPARILEAGKSSMMEVNRT